MPDRLGIAPTFTLAGVIWQCWVVDNGQAFEWRAANGLTVRRGDRALRDADGRVIGSNWVARQNGRPIAKHFTSIKDAMRGAAAAVRVPA